MVRLSALACLLLAAAAAAAQNLPPEAQFQDAGVCARCHVISVVEWGLSRHRAAATNCAACHGASQGHALDERNNVKPDRLPHDAAIAGLCATCHAAGCPKSRQQAGCPSCHHVHALVNPKQAPSARDPGLVALTTRWNDAARHRHDGEQLLRNGQWDAAAARFRLALEANPYDAPTRRNLALALRRAAPPLPGFDAAGPLDEASGLPRQVTVSGFGIQMVLVPAGDAELGSEQFAASRPVHSVAIAPFYLARFEMSQAEWKRLMGVNPSARQDDRLPVEQVSWNDAREMLRKLNAAVPGGGFRLPTEAEWEYAARAGGDTSGLFGLPAKDGAPRPADSGTPNALGLVNLQGNVWEWCSSAWAPYPYDAADGREDSGAAGLRVLRGGAFADPLSLLNPALRHSERPDRRLRWNGLRLARSVPELR